MICCVDVAPPVLLGLLLFLINYLDVYYPSLLDVAGPNLRVLLGGGFFDLFVALMLHYWVNCVCQ